MRLLELHAETALKGMRVFDGVQPEDFDLAAVGPPQPFHALHRRGLAGAVRANQAENLPAGDLEGHVVHRDRFAIGLPNTGHADHGGAAHGAPCYL
jgi:hypothetical protein